MPGRSITFLATLLLGATALKISHTRRSVDDSFASVDDLYKINQHIGGAGLRGTASERQNVLVEWLDGQLKEIPGLQMSYNSINLTKWEPQSGDLHDSATLRIHAPGACSKELDVAGAMPYTQLTNGDPIKAELLYIPQETEISSVNATNKIIIRDVSYESIPFSLLFALSTFRTEDMDKLANERYAR